MRTAPVVLRRLSAIVFVSASVAQVPPPSASSPATPLSTAAAQREDYDPLLDLPPLPHGTVTLIGGTVVSLDEVMNRMVLEPFGEQKKIRVHFDARTHFYRDGAPVSEREIRQGQRVYLDTMLNGDQVFAKSIWIRTAGESGMGRGQILEFDAARRVLTVRDELSSQALKLHLSASTRIFRDHQKASHGALAEGALVTMKFNPNRELSEVDVLAIPGSTFTFGGRLTYLDLSKKIIAVENQSDGENYDIAVDAIPPNLLRQLREGQNLAIRAVFDGSRYAAQAIDLPQSNSAQEKR
jgi:hypothetical protein